MITLTAHLKKYGMKRCPIDNSIKMIGRKFTLHILRNMILLKQKRFSQFLESIEGISTKTLSIRLNEMEKEGLITRIVISTKPVQIEYSLTEKGEMRCTSTYFLPLISPNLLVDMYSFLQN
jgi:DNA-binding HxlR family transcriptional regulator